MAIWDLFKGQSDRVEEQQSSLYNELKQQLPDSSEEELVKVACVAGLLARVAYVDFVITENEVQHIQTVLTEWTDFSEQLVQVIAQVSLNHIKELAGLENHLYVRHLKPIMDQNTRYKLIEALFALAASDGVVENIESEEIRIIVKGFDLSDQHFLAARATVADKLAALK